VREFPMMIAMTTTGRRQRRYDHRLRDLVHRTGDVTIATNLGVPRSTARGWLRKTPTVAVSLDVTNRIASELQQEILELRRRVKKLTALLRLALALLRTSKFTLAHGRLPDERSKVRILRAVDRAVYLCRCKDSSGSYDCPQVGFTPGDGCSTRVYSTTVHPVRTCRPID
jgi:hypothetical protein